MRRRIISKKNGMALSQIVILIVGVVAISYALGSEVREVKAVPAGWVEEATDIPKIYTRPSSILKPAPGIESIHIHGLGEAIETATTKFPLTEPETSGLLTETTGISIKTILTNALWGLAYGWALSSLAGMFFPGLSKTAVKFMGAAATAGYIIGSTFSAEIANLLGLSGMFSKAWFLGGATGLAFAAVVFLIFYRYKTQEIITFTCQPWQPPNGGNDCKKCGEGILPCSKYQCRSLGQSCELVNEGTDEEGCEYINRNDIDPPTIQPWEDILTEGYKYTPDNSISPPDRGVIVQYTSSGDKCWPAFTPVTFGLELNKRGRCKVSTTRKDSYAEMQDLFFSGGMYLYNHSITVSMPGDANEEAEGILMEGENELYVRCESANADDNGNAPVNIGNFVFKFCIEKGPDTTPPEIVLTDPLNGMPVRNGQSSVDVNIFVNEPAECRWSHENKSYDYMEGTMTCAKSITETNAQLLYKCYGTLTGLSDSESKFYFRCKDQPTGVNEGDRNVNSQSYVYTLKGTIPLVIDSLSPSGTVKGTSENVLVVLEAKTSAGYDEGAAVCSYNEKCYNTAGNADSYIEFLYTAGTELYSQHQHTQDLWLGAGTYDCSVRCCDLGNNCDTETTTYKVETDNDSPTVVRVYYESPNLRITTQEPAECVYDTIDCSYSFADGIKMSTSDDLSHEAEWDSRTNFYIKCRDKYGNEPLPDACSAIMRPVEL